MKFPFSFISTLLMLTFFQEDTGNSQPVEEEVTIISSDSELRPRQKIRRVTRKVRFSHPLAYQDPDFLLKRQIYESRRQTRTSKDAELSSGLPDVTRKRQTEVSPIYTFFFLWRVSFVSLSIILTPTIRIFHLPPVSLCSPTCQPSKLLPGNINLLYLMLYFTHICCI